MRLSAPGLPPDISSAIDRLLRQVKSFPLRLWRVATASLPTASDENKGGLVWDDTVGRISVSNGSAWVTLQPYDVDVAAYGALTTTGFVVRTGSGAAATRMISGPASGLSVTNGDGVAGNPTLALSNDLAALEGLSGTNTIYYRSAADAWSAVTIGGNLSFAAGTLKVTSAALTKSDDTNVTLTLGGSPGSALLAAMSLTLGWTGQLAVSRGGTGASDAAGARANLGLGAVATETYATGTFTPGLQFGGAASGMTFTTQSGRYTRVGRLIFFDLVILLSAKGSSTGAARITGLPFTSAAVPNAIPAVFASNMVTVAVPCGFVVASATSIQLCDFTGSTFVNLTDADFNNTSQINVSGCYSV